MAAKRPRVEHTEDWQELLSLCWWPEQVEYERMRQPVLFGDSVAERAKETGVSESTLRRRIQGFEDEGMEGLFDLGETLGEEGWVKFVKLDEHAPRQPRRSDELQKVLFPYTEAI